MTNRVGEMNVGHTSRTMLAAAAMSALVLGGCGGGATKTVSVSGTFSPHTTTQRTTTTGTPSPSPKTTTPASTAKSTSETGADETGGVQATRTTTAPAFTKEPTSAEGVGAAVAVVKAHGYTPSETSTYNPANTLRVLVGARTDSSDGYGQQAFFFVDGRYIGTDTKEPSASVKVVGQSDTEVTLAYSLYKPGDPLSHPSGGEATVRFQLNNGRLVALNPIPPSSSSTGTARN
jgi:LppP/LprE lipoprotein